MVEHLSITEGRGRARRLVEVEDFTAAGRQCQKWTLNRPESRNPLDARTVGTLRAMLTEAVAAAELRAVVITGMGPAFSAGGDLLGYREMFRDGDAIAGFMEDFERVCDLLERAPFVTAAMINGACVAGGLELALACDVITVAEGARVGDGHLRFGLLPGTGGAQRLVRAIGYAHAKRWLLTGELFSAAELVRVGLVETASRPDRLWEDTQRLVARVVVHSSDAVLAMKDMIRESADVGLTSGLVSDRRKVAQYIGKSEHVWEGLEAFAQKRPPRYSS